MKNIFAYPSALALGLALLASPQAEAQQFSKRKQYNSVGFSLNAMNYFGDLVPKVNFASLRLGATRPNVGVSITRRFYPRISGRLAFAYGRISGDDSKATENRDDPDARFRYHRNMNFINDIFEGSGVVIVDLLENRNNYLKRPDFVPYVFLGVAGFHHNPRGEVKAPSAGGSPAADLAQGTFYDLQPLKTEGQSSTYSLWQVAIPFGGGIRYRINRNFDAALEVGWRKTFTDYLDDVSGAYANPSSFSTSAQRYFGHDITRTDDGNFPGFNVPGAQRGNKGVDGKSRTDWYVQTGISINYILTPRIKNPKFR